ncbi:MAG: MotA/TolQ/ExbB proton channel family protein [Calditrichaeota bacterium]|nr:MotA/TolQ/ExbB proton channel family protein [Calditrichota bacterium]
MADILKNFSTNSTGWFFMWALLVAAVFMVAVAIERIYYIMVRSNINAQKFMDEIRKQVRAGDYKKAIALCQSAKKRALPQVVLAGLKKVGSAEKIEFRAIQNSVDEGTLEVIPKLRERTSYLSMIANVSTLLGLMGTIYGLIAAFKSVSSPGIDAAEKSRMLAAGISVAMNTTLTGLMIAVPAILLYTFIHNKTDQIIDEIDEHTVKLINLITGNQ